MQDRQVPAIIENYGDDLTEAGVIADHYASQDLLGDYQRTISDNTRCRQKSELKVFCQYLGCAKVKRTADELFSDLNTWRGISAVLLKGFIKWQVNSGTALSTVNIRLATMKRYCHLAAEAKVLTTQQHATIALVKGYSHKAGRNIDRGRLITRVGAKKAETTIISAAHAAMLKRRPDDTKIERRDALLMCLLLDHGLRCGEVAELKVQNVNLIDGTITFYREKVDVVQTHDLTADALAAAQAYLPNVAGQQYLFPGYPKDGVGLLGKRSGIDCLSPHDCRHHWATEAMKHNISIDCRRQEAGLLLPCRFATPTRRAKPTRE